MMMLRGAAELRRLVLEKWGYKIVSKGINENLIHKDWRDATPVRGYKAKFPCPICGGDAYESFIELEPDDPAEMDVWRIRWGSRCDHVGGGVNEVACVATPVEEDGVIVGMIEPVSPPEWPRYDGSGDTSQVNRSCAFFGTLWQAGHASLDECRLVAAIQAAEDEEGEVKRK